MKKCITAMYCLSSFLLYTVASASYAKPFDNIDTKYSKLAVDVYTRCLKQATVILKKTGEDNFSVDDCRNEFIYLQQKSDDFDDSISLGGYLSARENYSDDYKMSFVLRCAGGNVSTGFFADYMYLAASNSFVMKYRLGKNETRNRKIDITSSRGSIGFILIGDEAKEFLKEIIQSGERTLLVQFEGDDKFKALFEANNFKDAATDILAACQ